MILGFVSFWSAALIPFAVAIAPAPMNVFMGVAIVTFLAQKLLSRKNPFAPTAVTLAVFCLFIITCLSVFNSVDLKDSFKGGVGRLAQYVLLFFAVADAARTKKRAAIIVFSAGAGLLLASLDSIWQVSFGFDFIRKYAPIINIGLVRATGSFKDSNILGVYLSALAPLVFGLALYYYKGAKKVVWICVSLLSVAGMLLTYSRPTLLALYIAILCFGIFRKDKVLLGILVIGTLVSPILLPRSVKEWAKEVEYNPLRFMCNDDRIAVYLNSLNMIRAHPVIGVGAGAFMKSYRYYKDPVEYRGVVTLDEMKAHNNFFHMAGEIGLVGLGVFVWLLARLFREAKLIYQAQDSDYLKVVSLALTVCLISFLVNGLTESSLYYSRVGLLFWYLAGFLIGIKRCTEERTA